MTNFERKVALVTGASRGFGYQVAKLLAKKDFHIIGLARTVGALEDLSDEIRNNNGSSTMVPINLENDQELDNLALEIFSRWKKIDLLVHAASISAPMSPLTSISLKDFDKSMTINTRATIKLIQVLDPLIRLSKTNTAVFIDDPNTGKFLSSYSSSKAATREIIKNYKEESQRIGPKVISFTPSPMPTSLRLKFYPGENPQKLSTCILQAIKLIAELNL